MQPVLRFIVLPLVAGMLAAAAVAAVAAGPIVNADYRLVTPVRMLDPEPAPQAALAGWGLLRFAGATQSSGNGLSLQAGERWFARIAAGHSLVERDMLSVGGGFRLSDSESVSMHLTRALGQDRLGLAVRYDWSRTYWRLSYEPPPQALVGSPDRGVRFSAGVRW